MQPSLPLACFLSIIRPPGLQFEDSLLQILPVDKTKCPFVRDTNDIGFMLFTRHNPTVNQELKIDDDESLFASHFNFHDPTVIFFGAFMEEPNDGSGLLVRESYMLRGDYNFIILDLSRLEAGPWYFTAADNTWYIGNFAAKFIDYMVTRGLDLKKTHLVGHSLGAQSAGVAGTAIKSGKVSRITGLDPALPLFDKLPLTQRLDPSDAEFVDVIHTDAGIFGFNVPIGHADFYPNGGISPQPGCELEIVLHEQRFLNKFFCSHWRSYQFYSESVIRPKAFVASSCGSWRQYKRGLCATQPTQHMGFGVDRDDAQPRGFFVFHLAPIKAVLKQTFEEKLLQFMTFITNTRNIENKKESNLRNDDKVKSLPKLNALQKHKLFEHYKNKKDQDKDKTTFKNKSQQDTTISHTENTYTEANTNIKETLNIDAKADSEQAGSEISYVREKRITTLDNYTFTSNKDDTTDQIAVEEITSSFDANAMIRKENTDQRTFINKTIQKDAADAKHANNNRIDNFNKLNTQVTKIIKEDSKLQRQKRFISFFKNNDANENFLLRMLEFLVKNRKNVIPVVTVMREINTLVKSAGGELNHFSKERNNYIGGYPNLNPIRYDLELGESGVVSFVKKLFGLAPSGGKLSITGTK